MAWSTWKECRESISMMQWVEIPRIMQSICNQARIVCLILVILQLGLSACDDSESNNTSTEDLQSSATQEPMAQPSLPLMTAEDRQFLQETSRLGADLWYFWETLTPEQKVALGRETCQRIQDEGGELSGTRAAIQTLIQDFGGNPWNIESMYGASTVLLVGASSYCPSVAKSVTRQMKREAQAIQREALLDLMDGYWDGH